MHISAARIQNLFLYLSCIYPHCSCLILCSCSCVVFWAVCPVCTCVLSCSCVALWSCRNVFFVCFYYALCVYIPTWLLDLNTYLEVKNYEDRFPGVTEFFNLLIVFSCASFHWATLCLAMINVMRDDWQVLDDDLSFFHLLLTICPKPASFLHWENSFIPHQWHFSDTCPVTRQSKCNHSSLLKASKPSQLIRKEEAHELLIHLSTTVILLNGFLWCSIRFNHLLTKHKWSGFFSPV